MNNKKTTKRALLSSVMAIVLCLAMLIGTTFAWFTDSASTAVNKIQAGKLDIALEMKNADGSWVPAEGQTLTWKKAAGAPAGEQILWEPGATYALPELRIVNKGNLALKYKVVFSAINGDEDAMKLAEVLDVSLNGNKVGTLKDALTSTDPDGFAHGNLPAEGNSGELKITVQMQTTAGNDYQGLSIGGIAVTLLATQDTVENDSVGNDYDAGADVELATSATINGQAYASLQEAYEAVQPTVSSVFGLGQEAFSASDADKCAKFDELFPDGKITWTIYGEQKLTDAYMLSFGRKASYFGARTLKEIEVVGGNSQATLDLTGTNGTFALPYNWWGDTVDNIKITFKGITFKGIESIPGTWATPEQETPYTFENCTFNGKVYGYHDYNINLTIKDCTFNAPANTKYALMLQSDRGITGKVTVDGCNFNGYTRGINLQRPNTDFVVTNNTIRSTVSEPDRGAIQLTDGKSFVVTGNKVDVNAGNAFWFHNAATNGNVTYTISNNDVKAPYIGYSGVTTFDVNTKITSSGNKFNSTDTTKCMKKGATVAEATNLTAIH